MRRGRWACRDGCWSSAPGTAARLDRALAGRVEVEHTGHIDEPEAIRHLQDCFLQYLNYPFPAIHAVRRQTSFPTKLSTYVKSARPILIHAPADSSVTSLGSMTGYALTWDSNRASDGVAILRRAWADPRFAESFQRDADRVRSRYFDLDSNRRSLFGALNSLVRSPEAGHVPDQD